MPYYALTSELTDDYDERSSLTTYRMVMAVPAYLVGAALTPAIVGLFALQRTGYAFIGIVYGVLCCDGAAHLGGRIPRTQGAGRLQAEASPFKSFVMAMKNKPFVWLCGTYFIVNISFAFIKILMAYYIEYQLLMKAANLPGDGSDADLCDDFAAILAVGEPQDGQRSGLCVWDGDWRRWRLC